jgi:hypothetical protein
MNPYHWRGIHEESKYGTAVPFDFINIPIMLLIRYFTLKGKLGAIRNIDL